MPTLAELGKQLGKTESTVRRWIAAGMPQNKDGSIDVAKVLEWDASRRIRRVPSAETARIHHLDAEREAAARKRAAEARLKELEVGRQEGDLIAADLVKELFKRRHQELRQGLEQLPRHARKLAHKPPQLIAAELRALVRQMLAQFSRTHPLLDGQTTKRRRG